MSIIRKVISAIEPWYNWGPIWVERMDEVDRGAAGEGEVWFLELQWFGLHLGFQIGRTPKRNLVAGEAA